MLFAAETEGMVDIGRSDAVIIHCTYNTVNFPYNTVTFSYKILYEKRCVLRINILLLLSFFCWLGNTYMHRLLCCVWGNNQRQN